MIVTSPNEIDVFVEQILDRINAEFDPEVIPVRIEEFSKPGNCFCNVEEKIKRSGGKIHLGWVVLKTDLFYEAEQHAVWENPEGDLVDLTPRNIPFQEVMFISQNFEFSGYLDIILINTSNDGLIDDFIQIHEVCEKLYRMGNRVNDDEVQVPPYIVPYINQYEQARTDFNAYIANGGRAGTPCICGAPKIYKNCHGKLIAQQAVADLAAALSLHKKNALPLD